MRAIRNAVLSYGLVNVPVGVATAAKRKDFEFRTLHTCGSPIVTERQCPVCQKGNLGPDETVKGFEFVKKQFIVMDSEELERLAAERSEMISIRKFVAFDEVDDLQVETSYYLTPNEKLVVPYSLLAESMSRLAVVGVGTQALWGKETPAMVWANLNGVLMFSKLYCYDEVVPDTDPLSVMRSKEVPEEAQRLADEYVSLNVGVLNAKEDFVSETRQRMDDYITATVAGVGFDFVEPQPEPMVTIDVVAALKESILAARR